MVLAACFRYYNVLSVIFAKQCCIIHPVKEYLMFYNVCIELFYFKICFEGRNWQNYENAWGRSLYFTPFLFFSLVIFVTYSHKICQTTGNFMLYNISIPFTYSKMS